MIVDTITSLPWRLAVLTLKSFAAGVDAAAQHLGKESFWDAWDRVRQTGE
jgi:hypothetical protein